MPAHRLIHGVVLSRSTLLLTSPAFLLAIALLLLNDWLLKAAVGGWWTGKLSDFAGLFAFSVFWSALFPSRRPTVFAITAIGFLVWKSHASTPALDAWNLITPWPLARVIDYTDWMALLALVPAYRLTRDERSDASTFRRRLGAITVATISIVAFAATSVRRPQLIPDAPAHMVPGNAAAVRAALDSLGFDPYFRPRGKTARADTLHLYVRQPPERWVQIGVELSEIGSDSATLRVVELLGTSSGPPPSTEVLLRAFSSQVIDPLRAWLSLGRRAGLPPQTTEYLNSDINASETLSFRGQLSVFIRTHIPIRAERKHRATSTREDC